MTVVERALQESAEEVLETMFFSAVAGEAPPPAGGTTARLEFRGGPSGAFSVTACPGAARMLSAAFLAQDEAEVTGERTGEVICELANMICGSVLSRLKPDHIFELGHPELVAQPAAPAAGAIRRSLDLGGAALELSIEFYV